MSYKKVILLLALLASLILCIIVALLIVGNHSKQKTYEVTLTEEGFTPERLIIEKGDTVIFKTNRNQFFWPASNLHPTHLIYSDFDPKDPVDPKNSWSFKFERKGDWKYHDHLSPYYTGEIIVK